MAARCIAPAATLLLSLFNSESGDQVAGMFRALDADANGSIDQSELSKAADMGGAGVGGDESMLESLRGLFDRLDADADGALSRGEASPIFELTAEDCSQCECKLGGEKEEGATDDGAAASGGDADSPGAALWAQAAGTVPQSIDQNGDGRVDLKEALVAAEALSSVTSFLHEVQERFAAADTNRDGILDASELDSFLVNLGRTLLRRDILARSASKKHGSMEPCDFLRSDLMRTLVTACLFRILDADADGKIDLKEALEAASQKVGSEGADDEGEEGYWSRFLHSIQELFMKADTNRDGALDKAEAEKFVQNLGDRQPSPPPAEQYTHDNAFLDCGRDRVDDHGNIVPDAWRA